MLESQIQRECLKVLGGYALFAWRNNSGALKDKTGRPIRFGLPGSSDVIGILPGGRFIAIEIKTRTGRQSPAQVRFQRRVEMMGGLYLLVRSADELSEKLTQNGVEKR